MPANHTRTTYTNPPIFGRKGTVSFLPVEGRTFEQLPEKSIGGSFRLVQIAVPDQSEPFVCYIPYDKSAAWTRKRIAKHKLSQNVKTEDIKPPRIVIKSATQAFLDSMESIEKMFGYRSSSIDPQNGVGLKLYPNQGDFIDWITGRLDQPSPEDVAARTAVEEAVEEAPVLKPGDTLKFYAGDKVDVKLSVNGDGSTSVESVTHAMGTSERLSEIATATFHDLNFLFKGMGYTPETIKEYGASVARRTFWEAKKHFESDRVRMFNLLVRDSHDAAVKAGWHSDAAGNPIKRNFGEMIALAHSELSEALEAHRKNLMDDKLPMRHGVIAELIDTVIRCFDTLGMFTRDIGEDPILPGLVYVEKREYNDNRADHKPENRAKPNGKAY